MTTNVKTFAPVSNVINFENKKGAKTTMKFETKKDCVKFLLAYYNAKFADSKELAADCEQRVIKGFEIVGIKPSDSERLTIFKPTKKTWGALNRSKKIDLLDKLAEQFRVNL